MQTKPEVTPASRPVQGKPLSKAVKALLEKSKHDDALKRFVTEERVCPDPDCDFKGRPQPILSGFGIRRGYKGKIETQHFCRKCRSRRSWDGQRGLLDSGPRKPGPFTTEMRRALTEDEKKAYFELFDTVRERLAKERIADKLRPHAEALSGLIRLGERRVEHDEEDTTEGRHSV